MTSFQNRMATTISWNMDSEKADEINKALAALYEVAGLDFNHNDCEPVECTSCGRYVPLNNDEECEECVNEENA